MLEHSSGEEERMILKASHACCQDRLATRMMNAYRHEHLGLAIMSEMGALGFPRSIIREEFGQDDANYVSYGLVAREVERVDSRCRSAMPARSSLVMHPVFAYGADEQRREDLAQLAGGGQVGCFDFTEPDHGADPGSRVTCAKKVKRGYALLGAKNGITNSPTTDVFIVGAKSGGQDSRIKGCILERGTEGPAALEIGGKLCLRASTSGAIQMYEVFVPEDNLLPCVSGPVAPFGCLKAARYGIARVAMSTAETCFQAARDYLMDRKQLGRPWAVRPLIQRKLADMQTEIALGLKGAFQLGRMFDRHTVPAERVRLMKRNNRRPSRARRGICPAALTCRWNMRVSAT
ncbi:acyl-CoA dehydrogenase family protein [Roseobacter weihaiensis]|uniref:acyl-CoA dehydrogenase family protein n=1 Tax=Roseobacter weihaiensis TaxID=2763262 RepID=UPI001D0A1A08|nr:acyl-CoA dehydrogenase family protein [Roseobacter sp. H9]